jgi:alpha-tubulin suppressor-like RCC1 family protein
MSTKLTEVMQQAALRRFGGVLFLIPLGVLCYAPASRADSQVVTWGVTNSYGLGNIPANLTNVVALTAGASHSVALKANGKVVAWGDNSAGQTDVPASATNVLAIAAALSHTVALKSNGTIVAWGTGGINVPAGLTNVTAVAAGDDFSLALKVDGTVVGWGENSNPTNVPIGLSNVVAIAAGGSFGAALKGDGTVTSWALNSPPSTAGMTNVAAIAAGEFFLVALKADGTVVSSGGLTTPAGLSNFVSVAAGRYFVTALGGNGAVTNWGSPPSALPANLTNVVAVADGQNHCLALIGGGPPFLATPLLNRTIAPGGTVPFYALTTGAWPLAYQWQFNGTNLPGATNLILLLTNVLPADNPGNYSVVVTNNFGSITSSVAVLTVPDFSSALDTTGLVWTTMGNAPWFVETNVTEDRVSALQSGSITNNQTTTVQTAVTGPGTLTFWWRLVSSSSDASLLFKIGNSVQASLFGSGNPNANTNWQQQTFYLAAGTQTLQWVFSKGGNNSAAGSGFLDEVTFAAGTTAPFFTSLPVSQSQAPNFSVTLSGAALGTPPLNCQWLLCDTNISGATGASLTITNLQSSNIGTYSLIVSNVAGTTNADVTVEPGQVAAWSNPFSPQTAVPTGMTNVIAIAQGDQHSIVLKADGAVVGWDSITVPAGLTNIIAISSSAGAYYDLALKADGTVVAWGDNTWGQTEVPPGLTNVVAIAAGWYHGMALKADGTVVAWGYNWDGETDVPSGLTNVVAIAGGSFHSLAVTADGNVVVWGRAGAQLDVPASLTNAVAVAAGLFYCTALKADGTVVTWGDNSYGQTNVPADLTNATRIVAGWYHAIAAKSDGGVAACDTSSTVPAGFTNVIAVAAGYYNNLALEENSPPAAQAPLTNPRMDAGGFSVCLPTQSGHVYRLEYKTSLADTHWTPLPLAPGNGAIKTLTDPTAAGTQRFYRARQW